jgi:hypothetical protein
MPYGYVRCQVLPKLAIKDLLGLEGKVLSLGLTRSHPHRLQQTEGPGTPLLIC